MRFLTTLTCAALLVRASTVHAVPAVFFGEDLNPGTQGEANPPLTSHPQSDAARDAFRAHLVDGVETETFEEIPAGTTPPFPLTFGSDTATINGTATVSDTFSDGHSAVSGTTYLDVGHDANPKSFHIDFSTPQSAFGFYATDVGDAGAQILMTLHHPSGPDVDITVPNTVGAPSASMLYFGVIDADNPFDVVTLSRVPPTATDGFGFDDLVIARASAVVPTVDAFFLPKKVLYRPNAGTPAKSRFNAAGFFDTGSTGASLTGAATLSVGGTDFAVPGLTEKPPGVFVHKDGGLLFTIVKNRSGSSRAKFKLRYVGDLGMTVPTNGALELRFRDAALDGRGDVLLTNGGFRLGKTRGALAAPSLFPVRASAKVVGGGKDALALVVGLATNGTTPAASDLHVEFGTSFAATVPAASFTRSGDRYTFTGNSDGLTNVVLDYARETITLKGKGLDLGTFAQGGVTLRILVSLGTDTRAVVVRGARKGAALKY